MFRRPVLAALLASFALGTVARAAEPLVRIAKFSGDRAAAISYTFDDGLRDQYTLAVPMLDEAGFKGTFFIIPGRVSATVEDAERQKNDKRAWGTITWVELREMAAKGHEIASHTWSHPNLAKLPAAEIASQIDQAADAIAKEIGRPALTLAFPFNARTSEAEAEALRRHVAFRSYQLGVGGDRCTVESLDVWADKQVRDRSWGVAMAHAIASGYSAFADPEILRTHLRHVKSRDAEIWVDTFASVARYAKERDDARLTVTATASDSLTCVLVRTLDPASYDVPLTLVLEGNGAVSAQARRGDTELPARVTPSGIQVDAVPAAAPISISWK